MPNKTVLVVDDERQLVEVIESQLKTVGYQVLTAMEGNSALELAKSRKPDIILLDILMPGISGTEVAEELSKDPSTKDIPIVFLTALQKRGDFLKLEGMGKHSSLAKPFRIKELLDQLKQRIGSP